MPDSPNSADHFTRVSSESSGRLRVEMPDGKVHHFPILASSVTVGRAPENDIVLDHATVSRRHARFTVEGGRLFVEDLDSSNGTYVADQRVHPGQRVEVGSGGTFEFGQVKLNAQGFEFTPARVPQSDPGPPSGLRAVLATFLDRFSPRTRLVLMLGGVITVLSLVVACVVIGLAAALTRGSRERLDAACQMPPMVSLVEGGRLFAARAVKTAVPFNPQLVESIPERSEDPSQPLLTTAFLELPFPYDGGNENFGGTLDQFRLAIQRNVGTGGRVNSFFDHYLPVYPAPQDPGSPGGQEPAEPPVGKNILPFDGLLNPYFSYSGHPALDFSTFVYRQPTTPVFAAADGVIAAVGTHGASGALYVKINHTVQDVGDFQTIYWHLHPDEFFDAMLGREGEAVSAGTRVGTMGNTGYSTGHHLHFEIRFDLNQDGIFSGSEVVDPFGWTPSGEFEEDPWYQRSGEVSNYLWLHPLGASGQIPPDGGGQIAQPGGTGGEFPVSLCAQPGTLPPGGTTYYSWAPDPDPSPTTAGVGQGCVLSVLDADGQPVSQFDGPVKIVLPFDQVDLSAINPDTLVIYWQAAGNEAWEPLETNLDFDNRVAIAETDRPGKCALMGEPVEDILPPETEIQISGVQSSDSAFYDVVEVSLVSTDPSGVESIFYSLDNGTTWLTYEGPFTLQPGEVPEVVEMDEEFFGGLPGTYLVLASAVDSLGNIEDPPAVANFSIDPSKNPDKPTPADTSTPSPTPTATPTVTPTITPTATAAVCEAVLTLDVNAHCRKGPGVVYDIFTSYLAGTELPIEGLNFDGSWFWVLAPQPAPAGAHCWASNVVGTVEGDPDCMPEIPAPPTPTPKPVDTTPPPAPLLLAPKDGDLLICPKRVTLRWDQVSDPSGIDEYRWVFQMFQPNQEAYTTVASGSTGGTSANVSISNGCNSERYRFTVRAVDGAGNVGPFARYNTFSTSD